jgi:surface antigen
MAALSVGLVLPAPVEATIGVDDYPRYLKNAAQDSLVDPWNFYNRECTSFVAWRLNHDVGIAFHNWYKGHHWGDAAIWKQAAVDSGVPVDGTPRVGAIAWWAKGSPGSSSGHVAWVIAVNSSSITVEEYNYLHRGGYDRRTISRTASYRPTAYIHLGDGTDVAMENTARPTVSGTPQVGVRLTASPGTWTPSGGTYRGHEPVVHPARGAAGQAAEGQGHRNEERGEDRHRHVRGHRGDRTRGADGDRSADDLRHPAGGSPALGHRRGLVAPRLLHLPVAGHRRPDPRCHRLDVHPDG